MAQVTDSGVFAWDQSGVAETQWLFDSEAEAARAIKNAAKLYGAAACGITRWDPRWDYDPIYDPKTHKELSWEKDFPFQPKSVIVCLLAQDYLAMSAAPSMVADATVGHGYAEMAVVAGQLAQFMRELGYRAVGAGNDLGISTAYAVAAGLGELARAGWVIAPHLGPNIRICKVYTDFDFVQYDKPRSYGIASFCTHCKRCADACPAQAITHDDERTFEPVYEGADDPNYTWNSHHGVFQWHSDSKKCFQFWVDSGGGCASCVAACPYNKPDFSHHRFVDAVNVVAPGWYHSIAKELDRVFGYGVVDDPSKVRNFWKRKG
jgi:reductive dehalogenase